MSLIVLGVVLLLIGLLAYALGAHNVAGISVELGKWVLIVAVIIIVVLAIVGLLGGSGPYIDFD